VSATARPAPGERWTSCTLDHLHWGANGGAGLLFRHTAADDEPRYLLTLRSRWVDEPATWGIPGGAIRDAETPEGAARRETIEEIGQLPAYRVNHEVVQDCGGGWRFHIFLADVDSEFDAYSQHETDATGWFTLGQLRDLPLHPGVRRWLDELERTRGPSQGQTSQ
jgi:8-oxo-dGTP pyrophosphatase MutT (NUDIX family)